MLQSLWEMRDQVLEFVKEIQVVAAVLTGFGLSAIWVILRKFRTLGNWIHRQCSTSLIFSSGSIDGGRYNEQQFNAFLEWFGSTEFFNRTSRTITFLKSVKDGETAIGPGLGKHYLFYKRKLGYFNFTTVETAGVREPRYSVQLTLFTRDHKLLKELVDEFVFSYEKNGEEPPRFVRTYRAEESSWSAIGTIHPRDMSSVVLPKTLKRDLLGAIDDFLQSEEWYNARGLNYKLVILLHGKPGTGKSSTLRALATRYKRHLHILSLNSVTSDSLLSAFSGFGVSNSLTMIEDVDTYDIVNSRDSKNGPSSSEGSEGDVHTLLSLTDLLNALDGVASSSGSIVIMTANYIKHMDAAILRKGRIDHIFEIPYFTTGEVVEYVRVMYNHDLDVPTGMTYKEMPGCDLQDIFLRHKHDREGFLKELNANYLIPISTGEKYVETSNASAFKITSAPTQ